MMFNVRFSIARRPRSAILGRIRRSRPARRVEPDPGFGFGRDCANARACITRMTGASVASRRRLQGGVFHNLEFNMKFAIPLCAATMLWAGAAQAQVELKTYADANGDLDIQALTCAQLANTFQEDADFMTVWYSGWYNGLANYSKLKYDRARDLEHRVIVYCKAHPDVKVIKAMDINIKQMRKELGIKVNDEK
jgi:HdeA/HdeB family protein